MPLISLPILALDNSPIPIGLQFENFSLLGRLHDLPLPANQKKKLAELIAVRKYLLTVHGRDGRLGK